MRELKNFIDGQWVDAEGGGRFDVVDPSTGETIATAADSQPKDVERAIDAARRTFDHDGWPRTSERERGRILLRAATIVERGLERLAQMETRDAGKPIGEACHLGEPLGGLTRFLLLARRSSGLRTVLAAA